MDFLDTPLGLIFLVAVAVVAIVICLVKLMTGPTPHHHIYCVCEPCMREQDEFTARIETWDAARRNRRREKKA